MKRMRLLMLSAVLAVMTLGVQVVNAACPSSMSMDYPGGRYVCWHTSTDADGWCNYSCTFQKIVFV